MFLRSLWIDRLHHHHGLAELNHYIRFIYGESAQYLDGWTLKVICTLCVRHPTKGLVFFREILNSWISLDVVKRLNNPIVSLNFLEFSGKKLGLVYSVSTCRLILRILCNIGYYEETKDMFFMMKNHGYELDSSLLEFIVYSSSKAGKFDVAMEFLVQAIKYNKKVDLRIVNSMLNFLVESNLVDEALSFFKEHFNSYFCHNIYTFTIIIKGLCRLGDLDQAFDLLNTMGKLGCSPDCVTYGTLIDGMCRIEDVDRGYDLLRKIQSKNKGLANVVIFTSLILCYCKLGKMKKASKLFDEMCEFGVMPSLITYNVLIDGYGKVGDMTSAKFMYDNIIRNNLLPDVVTFNSLMAGYCRNGLTEEGMEVWREMIRRKLCPDDYTFSIIINLLCNLNKFTEALNLLGKLNKRNVICRLFSYNCVINGFCKAGRLDKANLIFAEMEEKNCPPNEITFIILIIGHCLSGRTSEAIELFLEMMHKDYVLDIMTINTLTSCFLKAGMTKEALLIRRIMVEKIAKS